MNSRAPIPRRHGNGGYHGYGCLFSIASEFHDVSLAEETSSKWDREEGGGSILLQIRTTPIHLYPFFFLLHGTRPLTPRVNPCCTRSRVQMHATLVHTLWHANVQRGIKMGRGKQEECERGIRTQECATRRVKEEKGYRRRGRRAGREGGREGSGENEKGTER